ncbi:MAG TPA: Smr/MutS family protein [Chitinophagales bacterium]|nr:Smr/MutS family protein [Chitinophagales bacterium]
MKKEKFSIGEKVFLVHLQEEAVINRIINDELMYVGVGEMEIPVFTSDVSREVTESKMERPDQGNSSLPQEKNLPSEKIEKTNKGIFLSLEPVKSGGEISSFNIFLINDTAFPIDFNYYFFTHDQIHFALKKLLVPYNYLMLHSIEYDLLNETPAVQLEVRDVMNQNFRGKMDQKIKPQNFFNKLFLTPIIQKETYQYKVQTQSLQPKKEERKEQVGFDAEVLKQMMMDTPVIKDNETESADIETDLHIEALTMDHGTMDASEMLHVQLTRFQQALDRAIARNAGRLYMIHGVGSGKLKNEIHKMLKSYKEVRSFNNDYHPRYGYGATEIILK